MIAKGPLLFSLLLILSSCFSDNNKDGCQAEFSPTFLDINLGSTVANLETTYKGIYKNQISPLGDFLYETCTQAKLEVTSFEENHHYPGKILAVVSRISKEGICRDANGALPDFKLEIKTPEGISFGKSKKAIRSAYGKPCVIRSMKDGTEGLIYRSPKNAVPEVGNSIPYYFFHVKEDKVIGITYALDWQQKIQ